MRRNRHGHNVTLRQRTSARPRTRLRFNIGGFEAEGFDLRLSRGRIHYRRTVGPCPGPSPQVIRSTEEQWRQFWLEVDRIGVWAWLPEYVNPNVLDGTQWSLELRYGERKVKSEGSNLYPGSTESTTPPTHRSPNSCVPSPHSPANPKSPPTRHPKPTSCLGR